MGGDASRQNGKKGGRPPGRLNNETLSKQEGRELVRQMVMAKLQPMIDAQVANAQGLKYMVVRNKTTGKFVRVTEAMARELEGNPEAENQTIEIWEKDPSVQAFTDLLNRALDKPAEAEPDQPWKGELSVKWQD